MSAHVDTLITRAHVLTLDEDRRVLDTGAIAIRNGVIVAVGPSSEVERDYTADDVIDARGGVVHPGLVDAHAHTVTDAIRGLTPKGAASWVPVETPFFESRSPEADYLGTLLSCMEMVSNGITTYADTGGSAYRDATVAAIDAVGLRGFPGPVLNDRAPKPDYANRVESTEICIDRLEGHLSISIPGRVNRSIGLSGMGLNSDELIRYGVSRSRELAIPLIMHAAWSEDEVATSLEQAGMRPVEHLDRLGALGPHLTLVHAIHLSDREIDLVLASGTRIVHCPAASMRRGMGAIRVGRHPEIYARGGIVGLGSDGFSGPRDILRQAWLMALGFTEFRPDQPELVAEDVLDMATRHAAAAVGLADRVGSLTPGMRADLVVHTTTVPAAHPRWRDPVDRLVFYQQATTVRTVLVDGEAILRDGQFTRFDSDAALAAVDEYANAFESRLGFAPYSRWTVVAE